MSLNRPKLDLTITQASTFSGVVFGQHIAGNTEHPLVLAPCHRMEWMRPMSVQCILQTKKSSKMYEIDQIYELRR